MAGRPGGQHFLIAVDVDAEGERWRFELETQLGPRIPTVADGRVYISTNAVHTLE